VISGLRQRGFEIEEVVAGGASPEEQRTAAPRFGSTFDPSMFDAIVIDALARIAVAPHLGGWLASRPVVALVHELPSVAGGGSWPKTVPPGFDGVPVGVGSQAQRGGPVRALCVAQWIERKGILTLVEAWTLRERKGAVLELIGETDADPDYAVLVGDAIEAGPRGSIVVSGCVDDAALGASYAAADLFVLPSRYEGYGIVYAEALAHGLPIIACDVSPMPELVGRKAAVLVRPDDRENLSAALDLLLGDPTLRVRMSAAATRRASRLPRWEHTVTGFELILRIVAETRKSGWR
jgi:glycosyltransferase involved in cell wall biosynthesis